MMVHRGISVLLFCYLAELLHDVTAADPVSWAGEPVLVTAGRLGDPVVLEWRANLSLTYRFVRISKQGEGVDSFSAMYVKEPDRPSFQPVGWASSDKVDPRLAVGWNGSIVSMTISEMAEKDAGMYQAEIRSDDNKMHKQKTFLYATMEQVLGSAPSPRRCISPEKSAECGTSLYMKAAFIFIIVFFIVICVILSITTYIFYKRASKRSRKYDPSLEQNARYSKESRHVHYNDNKVAITYPEQCTDEQSITAPLVTKGEKGDPGRLLTKTKLDTPKPISIEDVPVECYGNVCVRTLRDVSTEDAKKVNGVSFSPDDLQSGRSMYYSCGSEDKCPDLPELDLRNPQFVSNLDVPASLIRAISNVEIDKEKANRVIKSLDERVQSLDENYTQSRKKVSGEDEENFVNTFIKEYKLSPSFKSDLKHCLEDESFVFQVERYSPEIKFSSDRDTFSACYLVAASSMFGKQFLVVTAYTIHCKLLRQSMASHDELLDLDSETIQQYLRCKALTCFKEKGLVSKLKWAT